MYQSGTDYAISFSLMQNFLIQKQGFLILGNDIMERHSE